MLSSSVCMKQADQRCGNAATTAVASVSELDSSGLTVQGRHLRVRHGGRDIEKGCVRKVRAPRSKQLPPAFSRRINIATRRCDDSHRQFSRSLRLETGFHPVSGYGRTTSRLFPRMGDRVAILAVIRTGTPAFPLNPAGSSSVPLRNCQRPAPRMTLWSTALLLIWRRGFAHEEHRAAAMGGFARARFLCGLSSKKSCGSAHLGGGSTEARIGRLPPLQTHKALRQTSLQCFRCRLEHPILGSSTYL